MDFRIHSDNGKLIPAYSLTTGGGCLLFQVAAQPRYGVTARFQV